LGEDFRFKSKIFRGYFNRADQKAAKFGSLLGDMGMRRFWG